MNITKNLATKMNEETCLTNMDEEGSGVVGYVNDNEESNIGDDGSNDNDLIEQLGKANNGTASDEVTTNDKTHGSDTDDTATRTKANDGTGSEEEQTNDDNSDMELAAEGNDGTAGQEATKDKTPVNDGDMTVVTIEPHTKGLNKLKETIVQEKTQEDFIVVSDYGFTEKVLGKCAV